MRAYWSWIVVVGCSGGEPSASIDGSVGGDDGSPGDGALSLDPTPGTYRETCDGSGALAIDFLHFLDVNDENQGARIYKRATAAAPVQELDLAGALGLTANDEADLEDLARIGDRVFVTTSHGRKSSGNLDRARYRFAVFDLSGAIPNVTLAPAGTATSLLDQMLVAGNWDAPNAGVIAALEAASQLGDNSDATLAPENMGTNIEGLASDGAGKLLIGFRNPRPGGKAIVVALANPDAVAAGAVARFAGAAELDLGGLGVRGMAYSQAHGAVLIVAGPHATGGPFKLYRWSGTLTAAPVFALDLTAPPMGAPEAVVPYPGTKDVQIIFDLGDADVAGTPCKDAAIAERRFGDAIVHVE
jgi:hypothetical protein